MNNDIISVIVAVFNVEQFLDRCIESIVTQTHKNLEIILVDDGSTDGSGKICDEWEKKIFEFTLYINQMVEYLMLAILGCRQLMVNGLGLSMGMIMLIRICMIIF